jgi:hypothetical protein
LATAILEIRSQSQAEGPMPEGLTSEPRGEVNVRIDVKA